MKLKEIILILAVSTAISAEYVSYSNYKVYKIVPSSDKEVQIVTDFQKEKGYDFWSDVIAVNSDVRIMVAPEKQETFENYFASVNIPVKVVLKDVQEAINAQLRRPQNRSPGNYAWEYFQTLDEINEWLDKMVADYPSVVTLVTIGESNAGIPIKGVKIDFRKNPNPVIGMIEGGIHSREWISPATVTYIIHQFLTSSNPDVRLLAENVVWHIFPVVNPDGYLYTFSDNRMWRKNRNTANAKSCAEEGVSDDLSNGIDLNRNFGHMWMTVGATMEACHEIYAGPVEFSEPESRAIANYVLKIKEEGFMLYYFAFHSYSQMVLIPYSHLTGADVIETPNYSDMYEIAIRGMDKLKGKHDTDYKVGTSGDILYMVSGSSFDWVKGVAEIPIVYLFELRDVGEYGFLLPPNQIISNNEEIVAGLVEMDRVTRGMGYYKFANNAERVACSFAMLLLALVVAF